MRGNDENTIFCWQCVFFNGAMEYQVVRFSMFYVVTFVDCVQQPRCLSRSLIIEDRRTFQTDLSKPPRKIPRISPHLETHRIEKKPFTHPYQQQHIRTKLQHTPGTYPWNSTTRFIKSFHVIIYVFWCTLGYVQRVCWNLLRHPQPTTTTEHDQETFLSFSTSIGATCTLALAWAFCKVPESTIKTRQNEVVRHEMIWKSQICFESDIQIHIRRNKKHHDSQRKRPPVQGIIPHIVFSIMAYFYCSIQNASCIISVYPTKNERVNMHHA